MDHVVTWFEIPVTDMKRAKHFYAQALQYDFHDEEVSECMEMAMFVDPEKAVSGALVKGEQYIPNQTASVIYFNGGKNIDLSIERIKKAGGEITLPKTAICDGEKGHFAIFTDSEGNRVGLYSPPQ